MIQTDPAFMADSSFYGMLTAEERARLSHIQAAARAYRPGYMLMIEGEQSLQVRVLLTGWAKATFVTAGGEEVVLRIYGPGDLFGGEAALGNLPRSETVTALTSCNALVLSARRFTDLLTRDPGVARAFNLAMLQRAQGADEQIKLRHAPAAVRLARVLLDLARRAGTEAPDGITIPVDLSQGDLASWLGTSRSTVARMLHSLRDQGLIRTGYRSITITDPGQLRKTAHATW
jgi:CRP-like cAMP-binding protein